jgi:hypothetical protein
MRVAGRKLDSEATPTPQFLFGYASLVPHGGPALTRALSETGFVADLTGFQRGWGVAMNNRRNLWGYKYYTDMDGSRPDVYVAFLDVSLSADPAASVNGVCLPIDGASLEKLDLRERNYLREDVSDRVAAGGARVWTYVGSDPGRERLLEGRARGTAVIDSAYLGTVTAAFTRLGQDEWRACERSLDTGDLRLRRMERHELP